MADKKNPEDPKKPLQEESIIARLKSAAGGELAGLTSYVGLLGRSSREGFWLLYPTLDMSTSLEIQESDILHSEPLAPEKSPFGGLGGTRVFVRKGAQVTTTRTISRTHQAGAGDEFDLDIRVGKSVPHRLPLPPTPACLPPTNEPWCEIAVVTWECLPTYDTCNTCDNTCGYTCDTCKYELTCATCQTGCGATCQTCNTCNTCKTNCGTCKTCQTCYTNCTCPNVTCTCDTYALDTCAGCTHVECR